MRLQLFAVGAVIGACLLVSPAPTSAAPLAGAMSKDLATQAGDNSLVVQVQRRRGGRVGGRGGRGGRGGGGGVGAGVAAGVIGGMFLGAIIANEAQRQQAIDYCSQRYRSFDPGSMTFMGRDGYRHPCP